MARKPTQVSVYRHLAMDRKYKLHFMTFRPVPPIALTRIKRLMSTFSARKPPAPRVKLDFTAESPKIVEFLVKNGVSGQGSAGMVATMRR